MPSSVFRGSAERTEEVVNDMAAHAFVKRTHDVGINERGEDDRAMAFLLFRLVNTLSGFSASADRIRQTEYGRV